MALHAMPIPLMRPFYSDLSLIEVKDILQEIDPEVHRNYKRLREAISKAWERITDAEIRERIRTMHQRYLDVIDAHGMETK